MKLRNIIIPIIASFIVAAGVSASSYIIQPGDTLSGIAKLFNTTYQELALINNIINPNKIFAGDTIETGGMLGAAPFRPSGIDIAIRQFLVAGASRTGTTLNIDPIVTKDGHRWVMSDIGDIAFAKIDPGTNNEEIISWTGMTDNTTYYTLTGVVWGYDYTGLTTSTANYKRHNSGAKFIITDDDHYLRQQYLNKYDGLMNTGYSPSSTLQVATVGYVQNRNGYYEASVDTFADLPDGVINGEMRVTLDDSKVYVWNGSTWILAGAGGGAGTVYRDDIVATSTNRTYSLSSGSYPDKKYLQVFLNGSLLSEGASADYQASTTGNSITLNFDPVVGEVITLRVESIDFYNAEWTSVNDNLIPDTNNSKDIGSSSKKFKDLYLAGNASVGGTLGVSGTTTLSGITTISNTSTIATTTISKIINYGNYTNGSFNKDCSSDATTTIAHGLSTIPRYVRVYGGMVYGSAQVTWLRAESVFNGVTSSSLSTYISGATATTLNNTFTLTNTNAGTLVGVISVDATNIYITWTKTGSPTGVYSFIWEANN